MSRWVAIAAAVVVAILPYAVVRVLGIYDVEMMRAFERRNLLYSAVWVVAAAWLAAFSAVSRRRFVIPASAC